VPPVGQAWMVVRRVRLSAVGAKHEMTIICCDRPPTGEENHDGMLRSGGAFSRADWMVLRTARPPTGEENHDGMLRSGGASLRAGVDGGALGPAPYGTVCCHPAVLPLGQLWMVLRRARPPTGKENHDVMLRFGGASSRAVWMVVCRSRPRREEENHGGMLRGGGASPWAGKDGGAQGPALCGRGESRWNAARWWWPS